MTAVVLSALCCGGCGGQQEEVRNAQMQGTQESMESENSAEANAAAGNETGGNETGGNETAESRMEEAGNISIRFDESRKEYKAEDGTVLLTVESVLPVVDMAQNAEAAEAINRSVRNADIQGFVVEDAIVWAEEDYKEKGGDNWYGYSMGNTFTSQRADEAVISFTADGYSYMGGAHPNSVRSGFNFEPQTGRLLALDDITADRKAAEEAVNAYILSYIAKELEKEENQGMYFEDYESYTEQLLSDTTWYLAEDGFHIIGNEYIVSPHAAGILDFLIPYEQADFLKREYRYKK